MTTDIANFTSFVNTELPKRLSTESSPTGTPAGLVPLTTGVGLGVMFVDLGELVPTGKSAYELAVENGFEGTLEEWLDSLKPSTDFTTFNVGLVTAKQLPIQLDGTVLLPKKPYGGLMWDMALVHLNDGSVIEVTEVTVMGSTLYFTPSDYNSIKDIATSVTVSFIGDL